MGTKYAVCVAYMHILYVYVNILFVLYIAYVNILCVLHIVNILCVLH